MSDQYNTDFVVSGIRLSHPHLHEKSADQSGKMSYNLSVNLHPQKDADAIQRLFTCMSNAALMKWGPAYADLKQVKNFISLVPDADDFFPGCYKFSAKTQKKPPIILMPDARTHCPPELVEEEFYAGCMVAVQIGVYGTDHVQKTVSFSLDVVMKLGEGERIGKVVTVDPSFAGLADPGYVFNPMSPGAPGPGAPAPAAAPVQPNMFTPQATMPEPTAVPPGAPAPAAPGANAFPAPAAVPANPFGQLPSSNDVPF